MSEVKDIDNVINNLNILNEFFLLQTIKILNNEYKSLLSFLKNNEFIKINIISEKEINLISENNEIFKINYSFLKEECEIYNNKGD